MRKQTVTIPACANHEGLHRMVVTLDWVCPICGGPRGEPFKGRSYDGSRWLSVSCWINPCGHIDYYVDVRQEVKCNEAAAAAPGTDAESKNKK